MPTIVDVENAFAALLSINGRKVAQALVGEGAAPAQPYVMWRLDGLQLPDFPLILVNGTEQRVISAGTPLEFVVTMGGGDAINDAVVLCHSLWQTQRLFDIWKICGLASIGRIQDLSAVEVGKFRARAEVRISLSAALDLTVPPEWIESICVTVDEADRGEVAAFCVDEAIPPHDC